MGVRWVFGVAVLAVSLCGLAMGQSTDSFSQNKNKRGDTAPRDDAKRGTADEWKTVKTIFKSAEKFPFISQNARTKAIAGSIPLPTKTPMTVDAKATKLGIDFNGDGRSDAWAKGMKALQPLVLSYPDGSKARYAIYLTHRGAKWSFRYGGYRIGSFKGTRISLIDLDSDGYYDGQGKDGMIVGSDRDVAGLSSVLSIKGKLYECKVNRSGTELKIRSWSGESGKIDLVSGYRGISRLGAAIITNGTTSFNAARKNLVVPTGTYQVQWGHLAKGSKQCFFRGGPTVAVEAGKTAKHKWGLPYKVDFRVDRSGEKITVSPNTVTITGKGGEAYYGFTPAYTPKVRVRHPQTFKMLNSGTVTLC